jgi:DNA-binding protein YbaB
VTDTGLPADTHPAVAAVIAQAHRLQQVLDAQLYKMKTETFTGTDESETVEVTLDGHHNLVDVFLEDGLLRRGVDTVQTRIHEALAKATADASTSIAADRVRIDEQVADISAQIRTYMPAPRQPQSD